MARASRQGRQAHRVTFGWETMPMMRAPVQGKMILRAYEVLKATSPTSDLAGRRRAGRGRSLHRLPRTRHPARHSSGRRLAGDLRVLLQPPPQIDVDRRVTPRLRHALVAARLPVIPASSTATTPVTNMPSKVPAPPIESTGAPSPRNLSRFARSAPISTPRLPPT